MKEKILNPKNLIELIPGNLYQIDGSIGVFSYKNLESYTWGNYFILKDETILFIKHDISVLR